MSGMGGTQYCWVKSKKTFWIFFLSYQNTDCEFNFLKARLPLFQMNHAVVTCTFIFFICLFLRPIFLFKKRKSTLI